MMRVVLPAHLRALAGLEGEVVLDGPAPATLHELLLTLESRFPVLRGTLRHLPDGPRRPFIRFFACGEDLSDLPLDSPLPAAVVQGLEPFYVVAAIAGG
jgi:molybdopterin converting factor small subunit